MVVGDNDEKDRQLTEEKQYRENRRKIFVDVVVSYHAAAASKWSRNLRKEASRRV